MYKLCLSMTYCAETCTQFIYDMIHLLTAIGLSPDGSTHLHTNNTENNTNNDRTTQIKNNVEECGPCPVFASFTLTFALQLKKKHGKASVRASVLFNKNTHNQRLYLKKPLCLQYRQYTTKSNHKQKKKDKYRATLTTCLNL
jgi:hypothetical protein